MRTANRTLPSAINPIRRIARSQSAGASRVKRGAREMNIRLIPVILLGLSACSTEAIYMKNPATGEVATCGAHPLAFPIYATIAATHDQECVRNYKDQGFVR